MLVCHIGESTVQFLTLGGENFVSQLGLLQCIGKFITLIPKPDNENIKKKV
jgi:hypothetical protein